MNKKIEGKMASFQMENTPNPNTIKVNASELLYAGTIEYQRAKNSDAEFAQEVFAIDGVEGIFILKDFMTITKSDSVSFSNITPKVLDIVSKYLTQGKSLGQNVSATEEARDYSEVEQRILDVLEKYVRPAVAQDGGDIQYHGFKDGIVFVQMRGSCAGCPSSTATLKHGIETMMLRMVPEVRAVEEI
jgi:Fe-S cluster biogenesis protein NfuA